MTTDNVNEVLRRAGNGQQKRGVYPAQGARWQRLDGLYRELLQGWLRRGRKNERRTMQTYCCSDAYRGLPFSCSRMQYIFSEDGDYEWLYLARNDGTLSGAEGGGSMPGVNLHMAR